MLNKEGYKLVADADRKGVSPGSARLCELFAKAAPCLILIDEWIAYLRNLYGVNELPAGSFDANMTFAQSLSEAAKGSAQTMVVASLPASDIEKGGEAGAEALERLKNIIARLGVAVDAGQRRGRLRDRASSPVRTDYGKGELHRA